VAELLIPELWDVSSGPVMAEEGDQMRWWELAREFIMQTSEAHGGQVRAVFPDAGGAAMLKNRWGANATFEISSLDDKNPMTDEDTLVIITCPDPPSLKAVQRLADTAVEKGCPLVMFNPRLASGDVGIGVAVRDMRLNFLSTFNYVYSLAPIPYANGAPQPSLKQPPCVLTWPEGKGFGAAGNDFQTLGTQDSFDAALPSPF